VDNNDLSGAIREVVCRTVAIYVSGLDMGLALGLEAQTEFGGGGCTKQTYCMRYYLKNVSSLNVFLSSQVKTTIHSVHIIYFVQRNVLVNMIPSS
jgi:hypothetical protein